MAVLITLLVAALVVIGLIWSGILTLPGKNASLESELRQLLLDRAAGKMDDEEFTRRQAALHAALLEPKPVNKKNLYWLVVPVAIVFAGAGFYFSSGKLDNSPGKSIDVKPVGPMGTRFGSEEATSAQPPHAGTAPTNNAGDLNTMAKRLAEKMAKNPQNGEGWQLLARTYSELHQPKEAAAAYAKAASMLPPDATLLADWADAEVLANERKWNEEARKHVRRALELEPKHLKALALAGSEAFDRADYSEASKYFKRMLAAAPAGSMDAKLAEANLHEAEAAASGKKP